MNKYLQIIVVAPVTSSSKSYPTRFEIIHNKVKGWVVLDQIHTIDRQRIIKTLGSLSDKEVTKAKAILKETYID